jgi:hypothetical protein
MDATSKAPVIMNTPEAEEFVVELLRRSGPLTTMQIEVAARRRDKRCPDQTVLFLTKMKKKGIVKGEVSLERRGWIWWIP